MRPMEDPAMIRDHLAQAERHAAEGASRVARQREIIQRLVKGGHDATEARELLRQMEETQALHVAGRERLRRELSDSA